MITCFIVIGVNYNFSGVYWSVTIYGHHLTSKVQKYISRQDNETGKSISLDQLFITALVEDDITTAQALCKYSSGISIHH